MKKLALVVAALFGTAGVAYSDEACDASFKDAIPVGFSDEFTSDLIFRTHTIMTVDGKVYALYNGELTSDAKVTHVVDVLDAEGNHAVITGTIVVQGNAVVLSKFCASDVEFGL